MNVTYYLEWGKDVTSEYEQVMTDGFDFKETRTGSDIDVCTYQVGDFNSLGTIRRRPLTVSDFCMGRYFNREKKGYSTTNPI
jgi:hypothetical protein